MTVTYESILESFKEWCKDRPLLEDRVILRGDCQIAPSDTRAFWTNAVLNGLIDVGQSKFGFDTQPYRLYFSSKYKDSQRHKSYYKRPKADQNDCAEFLIDLCWYDYGNDIKYWNNETLEKISLNLVVESEWGCLKEPSKNAEEHLELVAYDFVKLLHLNADRRLFITQSDSVLRDRQLEMLTRLRVCSGLKQRDICIWYWDVNQDWKDMDNPEVRFP